MFNQHRRKQDTLYSHDKVVYEHSVSVYVFVYADFSKIITDER